MFLDPLVSGEALPINAPPGKPFLTQIMKRLCAKCCTHRKLQVALAYSPWVTPSPIVISPSQIRNLQPVALKAGFCGNDSQ